MVQNRKLWLKGISLILVILFISACSDKNEHEKASAAKEAEFLFVLSGAGLKCVLDSVGEEFTRETGIKVEHSYLCSAMVLTSLELTRQGDVFIPGSKYYFNLAREKGLVSEENLAIAGNMVVCITVQKGNPKNIQSLDDLLKPGMKLGVGDFEALALGRLTEAMLKRAGILDEFMKNVVVVGGTAPKSCLPVCMNSIDAAINWTPTAQAFSHCLDIVQIDSERVMYSTFPVALTIYARKKGEAMKYFHFVQSEKGRNIFKKYGFGLYFDPKPEQYLE